MLFDYDNNDEQSILEYAKKAIGKTFREIYSEYEKSKFKSYDEAHTKQGFMVQEETPTYNLNMNAKGVLGNFIEKYYFGYQPNGIQDADFSEIGIEIKQTCVDKTKKGELRAGERLSITNISYNEPVTHDFYSSHVWSKIKRILLIHYLRDKSIERLDYQILYANLFTPPKEDMEIIKADYHKIISIIESGNAQDLSEGLTMYLGACTKGSTALKSMQPQYYGNHSLAKKRNFCFKQNYMNYILHTYILKDMVPYESIIKDSSQLQNQSFDDYVLNMLNQYIDKSDVQLCQELNVEYNKNKAQFSTLGFHMLGIKNNKAAEFEKAGIIMKSIRVEENNKVKEHMSLPPFVFKELIEEEWEESTLNKYFEEHRFLFVIFKKDGEHYFFKGAKLWHMNKNDLESHVKEGWQQTVNIIKEGVQFTFKQGKQLTIKNNLPGSKDNHVIHVRPHTQNTAYKLNNGYEKGDLTKDGDQLPNGEYMTKQSFWINRSYIMEQIKEFLK